MKEVTAAKEAHLILAQTTLDHMHKHMAQAKRGYYLLLRFRIRIILSKNPVVRKLSKLFWMLGISKLVFPFIIDYQMVSIFFCKLHKYNNVYNRTNLFHTLAPLHKSASLFSAITWGFRFLVYWMLLETNATYTSQTNCKQALKKATTPFHIFTSMYIFQFN